MSGFKDHFSARSGDYAQFRPTYPPALPAYLASLTRNHDLALDVGCGTGQLTILLAEHYRQVIGTDPSRNQLAAARSHDQVRYVEAPAEQSGLEAGSVDLMTAAQAAHWFDLSAFYEEVRRVVRPGGILALISYGVTRLEGAADARLRDFYRNDLAGHWPPERRLVEEGYRSLSFPFDEYEAPPLAMKADWTCDELLGYVGTWSAVGRLQAAGGSALLDAFARDLRQAWGDAAERKPISWPLGLRVGRVG